VAASSGAAAPFVGEHRDLVASLVVGGWIGLTVAGSLLHLLALMARVRRLDRPAPSSALAPPVAAAAAVVAGLVALTAAEAFDAGGAATAGRVLLAVGYAVLGAAVVRLAVRAVTVAPLRL
jgi:hypothetical protein